jgi:hypothetical protein
MEPLTQPVAAHCNGFGLSSRIRLQADFPLIATGCNQGLHKGSIRLELAGVGFVAFVS